MVIMVLNLLIDTVLELNTVHTDHNDIMSFRTLQKIIRRPTERYFLEEKVPIKERNVQKDEIGNIIKDDIGNIPERWEEKQELFGTVHHKQNDRTTEAGQESILTYRGIFVPDFHLEINKLSNYRVRIEREYETIYLYITKYDPNNYVRNHHDHITLTLDEDKKYWGRQ